MKKAKKLKISTKPRQKTAGFFMSETPNEGLILGNIFYIASKIGIPLLGFDCNELGLIEAQLAQVIGDRRDAQKIVKIATKKADGFPGIKEIEKIAKKLSSRDFQPLREPTSPVKEDSSSLKGIRSYGRIFSRKEATALTKARAKHVIGREIHSGPGRYSNNRQ